MSTEAALRELRLAVLRAIAPVGVMTAFVAYVARDAQPIPWWGWLAALNWSGLPLLAALITLFWDTSRRAAAED